MTDRLKRNTIEFSNQLVVGIDPKKASFESFKMEKLTCKDLFMGFIKISIGLGLFGISSYWGYQACLKIIDPPVGTRLQYRYGDDGKGNFETMALTLCPDDISWYSNLGKLILTLHMN